MSDRHVTSFDYTVFPSKHARICTRVSYTSSIIFVATHLTMGHKCHQDQNISCHFILVCWIIQDQPRPLPISSQIQHLQSTTCWLAVNSDDFTPNSTFTWSNKPVFSMGIEVKLLTSLYTSYYEPSSCPACSKADHSKFAENKLKTPRLPNR